MNKENKNSINLYWSDGTDSETESWTFLSKKPTSLFLDLNSRKNPNKNNFLSCPAISNNFKKTLVFTNPLTSSYYYDLESITAKNENYLGVTGGKKDNGRDPSLNCGPIYRFFTSAIFFSDEPLDAFFTPPYFHKPEYTKYGSCIPGEFDIGQWYRSFQFEVQMWNPSGEFHLKEDEPLYYVNFKTKKQINLYRYNNSKKLINYENDCVGVTNFFGRGQSLIQRYERFKQVSLRGKILTEIKKNLIDEQPYQF